MKEISIFLASSGKLSEERTEIERLVARMNDNLINKGIYLRLRIWEKLSSTFEAVRKQDKFNDEVLKSDIFLCLFYDRIGQFSKEEFDKAYKGLLGNGKPQKMYVFFNNTPIKPDDIPGDYHSVTELKDLIRKYEQIYDSYENIDELIRKVKDNFELDLPELSQNSLIEEMKSILNASNPDITDYLKDNKSANILLTSEEYQRLNKVISALENKKIIRFTSNGTMIQNRPDGLTRTIFIAERLENYNTNNG
jgi:hypothetical protein